MPPQIVPANELFVVDDDEAMRDALSVVFTLAGYRVSLFADGDGFTEAVRTRRPSAVLLDLNLPDKSGLTVLREIDAQHFPAPIFIISGDGDVGRAVDAVKNGAFDYMVKPFETQAIVARVANAISTYARRKSERGASFHDFAGQGLLTPREREVLAQIAGGASNKEAGRQLGISPRTIEVHRARIMEKLGARNAADLVRIVLSGSGKSRGAELASGMVA